MAVSVVFEWPRGLSRYARRNPPRAVCPASRRQLGSSDLNASSCQDSNPAWGSGLSVNRSNLRNWEGCRSAARCFKACCKFSRYRNVFQARQTEEFFIG